MDGKHHLNEKKNNFPIEQSRRKFCDVGGPCSGQVSIGKRILASRQELGVGRNFLTTR